MELIERPSNIEPIAAWRLGPLAYTPTYLWPYWLSAAAVAVLVYLFATPWLTWAVILGVSIGLLAFIYRIAYNQTVVLYVDDAGVWISKGILPWNRGVHGVYWRDIESIVADQSILNWAFQSYPVRIVQRFTDRSEIRVDGVWQGHKAVNFMNRKLMELMRTQPANTSTDGAAAPAAPRS